MAKRYGRWEIIRQLDQGGQGFIYLVRDIQDSSVPPRPFVLKRLMKQRGPRLLRFKREVEILRSLDHPNIVKLLDAAPDDPEPYYVLEYYQRGSLRKSHDDIRRDPVVAVELFAQVCDGVSAAHARGVIHRDIKPDNVLLGDHGPVVADFGISYVRDAERLTETAEAVGPRHFMAPELAHGIVDDEAITSRCDVYSLGKLLYFMLTGQSFDREVFRQTRFNVVDLCQDERLERVNRLLDQMIVESPSGRLDDVEVVAKRVREIARLMKGHYSIASLDGGQTCRFCGEGHYRPGDTADRAAKDLVTPARLGQDYSALVCDHCGHLELFRLHNAAPERANEKVESTFDAIRRQNRDESNAREKTLLAQALRANGDNVTRTAEALGISRKGLQLKMKAYGLR